MHAREPSTRELRRFSRSELSIVGDGRPELSVVLPAYNEGSRIERCLRLTIEFFRTRCVTNEIIVVDDGSQDDTAKRVRELGAVHSSVHLVSLPRNRGKGAAIRAGVAASAGLRVLIMDADLATPIDEIALLERKLDGGAKIGIGSRALSTSDIMRSQPVLRVVLGRLANYWIRAWAVPGIRDTQCGFKLFDGAVARDIFRRCREDRFGIDIEALHIARRLRHEIAEVGVRWEHQDGSKVRPRDYLQIFAKVPLVAWSARHVSRHPSA